MKKEEDERRSRAWGWLVERREVRIERVDGTEMCRFCGQVRKEGGVGVGWGWVVVLKHITILIISVHPRSVN